VKTVEQRTITIPMKFEGEEELISSLAKAKQLVELLREAQSIIKSLNG